MNQSLHDDDERTNLAILTMHDEHRPFRGNHFNFIDLIKKGRELGAFVYVLTAKDIKRRAHKWNGYVYNAETKSWTRQLLPLPHVMYNRIPTRKDEMLPEVQRKIRFCLKQDSVRVFNPAFFNKWTLFEWLNKSKATKKFIPATKRLTSPDDLESFLALHHDIYLKPVRGKAGKGIMKVQALPGQRLPYRLSIQNARKSHHSHHGTIARLWSTFKQQIDGEDYLMQQAIALTSYNKRPFDLRVLVQKNQYGEWTISGIGARVAGRSSITTHVPRGGSIDEPEKLLSLAYGQEAAKLTLQRVHQAAHMIARQIERASGQTLGEMSMDLGIDNARRIWFFEANSRPMKFDEPDIRKRSLERIIQFSQYLARTKTRSR
ncbi:YheC/YheD family endospore coat-associated protein [Paenibacillus cymbidii]|uniref:YheC/YheD family endospore coat-associated protein n=1 Tax=Paenibacillus cymbidii TaxID=1639034 RepID=UPI0010814498|nr:YheC/YheD family protein [Paenibacillus cymbidii]